MLLCVVIFFCVTSYRLRTVDGARPHQQVQPQQSGAVKMRDCEPIEIAMCRGMGYDATGMPNLVGHESQQDAEQQLRTFTPLIQYGCDPRLTVFLCSAYAPMCTEKVITPIGPCAFFCESVRRKCEPVLNEFGFPWPLALNCSKYPPRNDDDTMCMEGPKEPPTDDGSPPNSLPLPSTKGTPGNPVYGNCDLFRNPSNYIFLNRTQKCALLCSADDIFNSKQKNFADAWMSVWSGLCFVTTLVTILTFLIDSSRFVYPERALVFVVFCYCVCSVSYLVRLIAGRDVIACHKESESTAVLVQEGHENTMCTVVFLLLYYFSTAGFVWWVILTVLWFLNSGLELSYESLSRHGTLLHVVAWSVPAATTIAVFVLRSVNADELTAMCHVGYHNQTGRLWFVLVPTGVFLLLGIVFLAAGFICYVRSRKETEADEHGKARVVTRSSTIRIGAFCLVHVVLTIWILSVHCYEYANRHYWSLKEDLRNANVTVLMTGVGANLMIGILSAIWLWRGESLQSWQRCCSRLCHCCCGWVQTKDDRKEDRTRKHTVPLSDANAHQSPVNRPRPIYYNRVTTPTVPERSGGRDPLAGPTRVPSHLCRHHFYQRYPLINNQGPMMPCERMSLHTPLPYRVFNKDTTAL